MKPPALWQSRGICSTLLLPLSWLYGLAGWLRWQMVTPYRATLPVICVGNAVAGGAGKTPVALAIAALLKQQGATPHFLSRGYGGKPQRIPLMVTSTHRAVEVGDEPKLLARMAPCWVSVDRVAAAKAATTQGASLLLMDDGLQNPSLHKDIALLVIDGATGTGNDRVIPAGPLREPLSCALSKADAVVMVGENRTLFTSSLPMFAGQIIPLVSLAELPSPVVAFAGIGRPEKFFSMLRANGVTLAATMGFPDHHLYSAADIARLRAQGIPLVTTAKDAVKLPADFLREVTVIDVAFQFDDPQGFAGWLQEKLS